MDEARFGRINDPRRCWAPPGCRPVVKRQAVREYTYAYGAACPRTGSFDALILPDIRTACLERFLVELSRRHADTHILLWADGAGSHKAQALTVPANLTLKHLPPYSPELNPVENLWDELREKTFKNLAFDSLDAVEDTLAQGLRRLEKTPDIVRSITAFPWIVSH
ncbi:MAG: IS630 family transposase [Gammaproteobacteria bacterium]